MKNIILVSLFIVIFSFYSSAQKSIQGPSLKFTKENHNYGKVHIDNLPDGKIDIEFTNDGNQPLVLSNVKACCGTRVLDWPKEPILPGKKGTIKIEFRLQPRVQTISRTVTVFSNSPNSPDIFRITGEVTEESQSLISQ